MRLVVDTNIIVSALLSSESKAFQLLSDVLDGKYIVLISEEIFKEYEDVLSRDKFGFDSDIINFLLNWFRENAVWVEGVRSNPTLFVRNNCILFPYISASCSSLSKKH